MKTQDELKTIIEELKKKGIETYTFPVTLVIAGKEEVGNFIFKEPGRLEHSAIIKGVTSNDSLRGCETFIHQCYCGGDDKSLLLDNFKGLKQVEKAMFKLIDVKEIEIIKN